MSSKCTLSRKFQTKLNFVSRVGNENRFGSSSTEGWVGLLIKQLLFQ